MFHLEHLLAIKSRYVSLCNVISAEEFGRRVAQSRITDAEAVARAVQLPPEIPAESRLLPDTVIGP